MARKSIIEELNQIRPNNKNEYDVKKEMKSRTARLVNFGSSKKVEIIWDMTEDSKEKGLFYLSIDCGCNSWRCRDSKVLLASEDIQRYLRWV